MFVKITFMFFSIYNDLIFSNIKEGQKSTKKNSGSSLPIRKKGMRNLSFHIIYY